LWFCSSHTKRTSTPSTYSSFMAWSRASYTRGSADKATETCWEVPLEWVMGLFSLLWILLCINVTALATFRFVWLECLQTCSSAFLWYQNSSKLMQSFIDQMMAQVSSIVATYINEIHHFYAILKSILPRGFRIYVIHL
jgi:hypothetical protein